VRAADQKPLEVSASADKDSPSRTVLFRGQSLADIVPFGSTEALPELPRLVQGIADRDPAELSRIGRWAQRRSEYSWGLRYSVWCTEETPFVKPAVAMKERLVVSPQVCDVWKVRKVSKAAHKPVSSDVPALLLSGEYDPETPPTWAAAAAKTLSKAQMITFRGLGHVPSQDWSAPCAMSLADAFLREPTAPLDLSCAKALSAPAFKTETKKEQ
jgi:pimeloyl-ACP methyl ester carboxylesterase